jgi:hypothetical protein
MNHITRCPRCGSPAMEYLATHAHCWECAYSPESDRGLRMWRQIEFPHERPRQRQLPLNIGRALHMPVLRT